ncbi:MAG: thiamine pyrophosphate-dependent enzyme [Bryobacteraceae bacterium]
MSNITVSGYLKTRLEQLGLDGLFCVAGNYAAPFLDTILEDESCPIAIFGVSNEICAGYAADGYARLKGIGCVVVTYGVGAFSLLNAVTGSLVENAPVVVVNGAPTNKEFQNATYAGLLYSHMTSDPYSNLDVYQRITVNAERITSAGQAPYQIDSVLTACVTNGQPVYLEVLEDVWRALCDPPSSSLPREQLSIATSSVLDAVAASIALIEAKGRPLFWAGVEIQRQRLQQDFLDLIERTDFYFTTSLLGKSVVSEDHPRFVGVFAPTSPEHMKKLVGGAGCLIGLGAWTTGKDVNNENILGDRVILAARGGVFVGPRYFPSVMLRDYIQELLRALDKRPLRASAYAPAGYSPLAFAMATESSLTYDAFFNALNRWLTPDKVVISDAGFPLLGAQDLHISAANGFVAQAAWLAIGYSTAAAIGVKCAVPEKRAVVVVGDGGFQETCQAVSSHKHLDQNTVVFVLANGIYGIEQKLVNPNPFRTPAHNYDRPLLNSTYSYNNLHDWNYETLTAAFGGEGRRVDTIDELRAVLSEIDSRPSENFLIHVRVPSDDVPYALRPALTAVGEDETLNPDWPPVLIF